MQNQNFQKETWEKIYVTLGFGMSFWIQHQKQKPWRKNKLDFNIKNSVWVKGLLS